MRIAFVSTVLGYPWGGADTLWTKAAEAAAARGDSLFLSVSAAVADHPRIRTLIDAGAGLLLRAQPPDRPSLAARVRRQLGLSGSTDAALIAALAAFRPDAIVVSQGGTYDLLLHRSLTDWMRASATRYRLVANWQEEHPQLDGPSLAFIRDCLAGADSVNFVSTRNLDVTRRHLGLPLPNARVLHNPLRWQPADTPPWPAGEPVRLATVSRLDEGKGIHLLFHSLADCGDSLPAWELNIHGDGPQAAALQSLASRLGLTPRINFRGYVEELRAIWSANQLMVSPALEDGVPMTIPEAMLCRRPVLATRIGGAEDWLRDDQTGFLCPEPRSASLAATLQHAFSRRDRWQAMGAAAAAAALAHYRPDDYLKLLAPC